MAILAIQSVPHPVILFNNTGGVVFTNNACRFFFKLDPQKNEAIHSIEDLPELFGKIWTSGKNKFLDGKGFTINGPVSIKGVTRRIRIDMIPIMDHGDLQFISSILLPEPAGIGPGGAMNGMNTLLDESENRIREIRFLASTEETYRMRRISLYTTEVLKKIRELREISYPGHGKENQPNKIRL